MHALSQWLMARNPTLSLTKPGEETADDSTVEQVSLSL